MGINHKRLQDKIHRVIFGTDTKAGQLFDVLLLIAIVVSVSLVLLESIVELRERYTYVFYYLEWFFSLLFLIEYVLRIYSHPKSWKYIFSFWGMIDLLAVLPVFVLFLSPNMQYLFSIRLVRLMRMFRIMKLGQHFLAAQHLSRALRASSYKISVFILGLLTLVIILGSFMYVVEEGKNGFQSIPLSVYWAIITITTVGYGDIVPQTDMGKFIASFIMLLGYGIIAVPTGIITAEIAKENESNFNTCPRCQFMSKDSTPNYCSRCGHDLCAHEHQYPLFED
ncbi:MAG: ion transporter [Bernardetiaceae bacterium]|nr:ion transporter [Bernardetiaceae bacterium]